MRRRTFHITFDLTFPNAWQIPTCQAVVAMACPVIVRVIASGAPASCSGTGFEAHREDINKQLLRSLTTQLTRLNFEQAITFNFTGEFMFVL